MVTKPQRATRQHVVLDQPEWGRKLRAEREAAGVSQEQLMYATHISQTEISRWENGKRNIPNAEVIVRLEEGLGISDGRLRLSGGRVFAGEILELDESDPAEEAPIIHDLSAAA